MYEGNTVGVVVPAYDEAGFVRDVIESLPAFVDVVYAVDDHSTDETYAEMRRAGETWAERPDGPTVVSIRHRNNRGVGGAIKTGYLRARADRIDVTVVMAGDGQMEVEIFEDVIDPIVADEAEYVKANRFLSPEEITEMPALRRFGNRLLEGLTRIASGYWAVGDPQSGYTAISLDALDALELDDLYEFYGYCNEILVRLNARECRVVDVPRPVTYGEEESGISLDSYVPRVSVMLLRSFLWRLRVRYLDRRVRDVPLLYGASVAGALAAAYSLVVGGSGSGGASSRGTESRATPAADTVATDGAGASGSGANSTQTPSTGESNDAASRSVESRHGSGQTTEDSHDHADQSTGDSHEHTDQSTEDTHDSSSRTTGDASAQSEPPRRSRNARRRVRRLLGLSLLALAVAILLDRARNWHLNGTWPDDQNR